MTHTTNITVPNLAYIEKNYQQIKPFIRNTPILKTQLTALDTVYLKLELLQKTGTFKLRGALTHLSNLSTTEKQQGVITATGGNHGIALAQAAQILNIDARIIIPETINQTRLHALQKYNVHIDTCPNITDAFEQMQTLAVQENRTVIHPFNHPLITLGTASLGYEFLQQVPDLDVLIVAIGGGGLGSGVASAAKQINPNIQVFGVEPQKANSMQHALQIGEAVALPKPPCSIADSLNAPEALPYSYTLCQQFLDEVVTVSDTEIAKAMHLLFETTRFVCEPACAAATAGFLGPLYQRCKDLNTGIILCGSNIGLDDYQKILEDFDLV